MLPQVQQATRTKNSKYDTQYKEQQLLQQHKNKVPDQVENNFNLDLNAA